MGKRFRNEPERDNDTGYDSSDSYKQRNMKSLRKQRKDSQDRKRYENLDALLRQPNS